MTIYIMSKINLPLAGVLAGYSLFWCVRPKGKEKIGGTEAAK